MEHKIKKFLQALAVKPTELQQFASYMALINEIDADIDALEQQKLASDQLLYFVRSVDQQA